MKELALVVVILSGLGIFTGVVEVTMPVKSKCTKALGVEVCVGRDEGSW